MPGFHGKLVHTERVTLVAWEIDEGAILPEHSHPHEQMAIITEGQFEITVGGETQVLVPGVVGVIPGNVKHSGKAITACKIFDVFQPPREDYM